MIVFPLLLALAAQAKSDSSSAALYEYLASKGYELWRTDDGGFIRMQTFSCNSIFLKDIKVQLNHCWYSAAKDKCQSDVSVPEDDIAIAKGLYAAMTKMGLPILANDDSNEKWRQIDADGLNCMMTVDHTTEPATKDYQCWAMKKLKN